MRTRALAAGALSLALSACHDRGNAVLLVVITASGSPPSVVALDVQISGTRAGTSSNRYTHDGQPITFPTTLSAELPDYATGVVNIDVVARDASGATVASGHEGSINVKPGQRETAYVRLDCGGDACVTDGGTGNGDGGPPTTNSRCGNGRVDPGETCDTGIAPGDPGACPPTCDDHVACTQDKRSGSDCTVTCTHVEIRTVVPGDGCCPAGADNAADSDCRATCGNGVVDLGETCDIMIPRGVAGACPADCNAGAPCATSLFVSAGTCSAVCLRYPIVAQSGTAMDNCCPPGATHAVDADCKQACGNGAIEPGETCDVGIPPLSAGACPTSCEDGDPCTIDYFSTVSCTPGCLHFKITVPISGDGLCCPEGGTHTSDTDCAATCGNGVVEPGEACDGDCPTSCNATPSGCLRAVLTGSAEDCSAHCELKEVTTCAPAKDRCCPAGCTPASDGDCSPRCGDGLREPTAGEVCDIAAPLSLGGCPTTCVDADACTDDRLLAVGTCSATCVHLPITAFRPGDGCCPPGAAGNFTLDPDCAPTCGNGIVETPAERCDWAAGCPEAGSCPASAECTRYVFQGSPDTCSATCLPMPITTCVSGDDCCPSGCTLANDTDCHVICGDGVVEDGESCDRAITAGTPGACLRSCDDGNACTLDLASGSTEGCSRDCIHQPITACLSDDRCCPPGCSAANDGDCDARCGDGRVGAGETCDPPSTCPTRCPDDGDPCTAEQLTGDAAACTAACRHVPITACSGARADACCPTGCSRTSDSDC